MKRFVISERLRDSSWFGLCSAEKFLASTPLEDTPPTPCDFKVGDLVRFTNDLGVEFGPYNVIGFTDCVEANGRFVYIDYQCVWFPCNPRNLSRYTMIQRNQTYQRVYVVKTSIDTTGLRHTLRCNVVAFDEWDAIVGVAKRFDSAVGFCIVSVSLVWGAELCN